MFTVTSMVAMSIAATRTHRQLVDFVSVSSDEYDIIPFLRLHAHGCCSPNDPNYFQANRFMPVPPKPASFFPQDHVGMPKRTTCEQYQKSLSRHSGSFMSADEPLYDKPADLGLGRDDDMEGRGPA